MNEKRPGAIRENTVIVVSIGTFLVVILATLSIGIRLERITSYLDQAVTVGDHREWARSTVAQSPGWAPADMDAIHDRRHGHIEGFR